MRRRSVEVAQVSLATRKIDSDRSTKHTILLIIWYDYYSITWCGIHAYYYIKYDTDDGVRITVIITIVIGPT